MELATKYGKRKQSQNTVLFTLLTILVVCAVFFAMVRSFYSMALEEANEMLHMQTKQIKDDITLQMKSDRENLATMASFAAKLYMDGEGYDILFESFKPIGLISEIGILNEDNTFSSRLGRIDMSDKLSFSEEAAKGTHITGRIKDIMGDGKDVVRSAVPIVTMYGRTVGMLYGQIPFDTINGKYKSMAKELDAQLFVYDKENGKYIINTRTDTPGSIEELRERTYLGDYSYEQFTHSDNGFTSFKSIYNGEDLYVHYSTLEDFNWGILLARYESQVFEKTSQLSSRVLVAVVAIILVTSTYLLFILRKERKRATISSAASGIRKLLLDVNQQQANLSEALKSIQAFSGARSSFFVDTDGEEHTYILPQYHSSHLLGEERKYFISKLFRYAADFHTMNMQTIGYLSIRPDTHLTKTNPGLYGFLRNHGIQEVGFATITDTNNHVSILGVINPGKSLSARELLQEIAVCFSIAIYNKKRLNRTEVVATTDSLTGVANRVSFKKDIIVFDEQKPTDFTCIYIDVNELHLRNNKYGHAAGDEMLIYIANTLKEVFFGQSIYRMGGDEFLVFAKDTAPELITKRIEILMEQLKVKDYHVAIGTSFRKQNAGCEEMVKEAEIRMYEAKAQYYQNKEQSSVAKETDESYVHAKTGILEIDTMISVLKEHYNGIYRVSLDGDSARRILMPSYLGYNEEEKNFSRLLQKYIEEIVHPDFHRAVMSFLNYDAIKRHLMDGKIPKITYKKANGEPVILSIYKLGEEDAVKETLWVFAKG